MAESFFCFVSSIRQHQIYYYKEVYEETLAAFRSLFPDRIKKLQLFILQGNPIKTNVKLKAMV